jgi:hypothetical protein
MAIASQNARVARVGRRTPQSVNSCYFRPDVACSRTIDRFRRHAMARNTRLAIQPPHSPGRHNTCCCWARARRLGNLKTLNMKYRKLRIAWSVAWGIVAMLLAVLWVRSYRSWDCLTFGWGAPAIRGVTASSFGGVLAFQYYADSWKFQAGWGAIVYKTDDLPKELAAATYKNYHGFRFGRPGSTGFGFVVPTLFSAPLAAVLAVSIWLPGRFSLRTLLITITLVAVGLGYIIWATK